jgi:hypothetical protein
MKTFPVASRGNRGHRACRKLPSGRQHRGRAALQRRVKPKSEKGFSPSGRPCYFPANNPNATTLFVVPT